LFLKCYFSVLRTRDVIRNFYIPDPHQII
jgi:hypothetical protein